MFKHVSLCISHEKQCFRGSPHRTFSTNDVTGIFAFELSFLRKIGHFPRKWLSRWTIGAMSRLRDASKELQGGLTERQVRFPSSSSAALRQCSPASLRDLLACKPSAASQTLGTLLCLWQSACGCCSAAVLLIGSQALKQISAAEEPSDDASVEEVEFDDGNVSYAGEVKDRSQTALINEHRTLVGEVVTCALCKDKGVLGIDCQPEDIRGVMVGPAYVQQRKTSDNPKFVHLNCALFSPEVRMDPPPTWTASTPETRNMLWGVYHATSSVCHVHDHHTMGLHIKHLRPVLTRPKKKCCVCGKAGAFTGCALQHCSRGTQEA